MGKRKPSFNPKYNKLAVFENPEHEKKVWPNNVSLGKVLVEDIIHVTKGLISRHKFTV